MKRTRYFLYGSLLSISPTSLLLADTLESIQIEDEALSNTPFEPFFVTPEDIPSVVNNADFLKRIPGANVNKNGALTGIPQYRGMFGDRVNVLTDGINVKAAGPNAMDPAMSSLAADLTEVVTLYRGIAPVSSGVETIGSTVKVETKSLDFGTGEKMKTQGTLNAKLSSVDKGKHASAFVGAANKSHKIYVGLATEQGDSFSFKNGENFNTDYDRDTIIIGYGFQSAAGKHQFDLNYHHNDTGKTGTPALPMDIAYVKGDVINLDYTTQLNDGLKMSAKIARQDSDHKMSNFQFRTVTAPARRFALTDVKSDNYKLQLEKQIGQQLLTMGINGDTAKHRADIFNPDNSAFKVTNYDVERDRNSVFAEVTQPVTPALTLQAGLRYTNVKMNAADVSTSLAATNTLHRVLRDRFNARSRKKTDDNIDLAVNMMHTLSDHVTLEYGLAHKTRSPSYQERYLYLPLESTAGLADGRQYFGNIDLKPEKATQLELGTTITTGTTGKKSRISPHVFYHRVDDYIQGTPTTSTPAPANTLTFNNIEAEFYGLDMDFYHQLSQNMSLDGTLSHVRGKRRDIADNLYRIAPSNIRVGLQYQRTNWSLGSEIIAYAKQDKVSQTNSEKASAGYALLNLNARYQANKHLTLSFGIDNLLDKGYTSHLSGYNRNNRNTDVGFDANDNQAFRLPAEGRNVYATVKVEW